MSCRFSLLFRVVLLLYSFANSLNCSPGQDKNPRTPDSKRRSLTKWQDFAGHYCLQTNIFVNHQKF